MRYLNLLIAALCASVGVYAQSNPTTVKYDKVNQPGLVLAVPYSEEIAEGAIVRKLNEIGYNPESQGALFWKKNTINGFYVFKNVALRDSDGQAVDLYFDVERRGKKSDQQSNIYMIVSNSGGRFISSESDPTLYNAAANFLNGLADYSAGFKMDTDIKNQEQALVNAEKKHKQLQTEEENIMKKIKKLEEDLTNNRTQQENQLKTIESETKRLEELRARKTGTTSQN